MTDTRMDDKEEKPKNPARTHLHNSHNYGGGIRIRTIISCVEFCLSVGFFLTCSDTVVRQSLYT